MLSRIIDKILLRIKMLLNSKELSPQWVEFKSCMETPIKMFIPYKANEMYYTMSKGEFDQFIYKKLNQFCFPNSPIIWDVGGHIGYHTLNFSTIAGKNGKVVTFEPNPWNRQRLQTHLDKNTSFASNVTVYETALSDREGTSTFYLTDKVDSGESSGGYLASVIPPLGKLSYRHFKKVEVQEKTADSIVNEKPELLPDVIKIDVEGAELKVLKGMQYIIEKKKPIFFIEVHSIVMMFYISELLQKKGFNIEIIDEENATVSRCFILCKV